jgi:hypothetical protein
MSNIAIIIAIDLLTVADRCPMKLASNIATPTRRQEFYAYAARKSQMAIATRL